MEKVINNENIEICKKCGGVCCKNYAGAYHPNDFGDNITYELLESAMETNNIAIDWYEMKDNEKGFYLRPRHTDGGKVDPSWGAQCVNLTDNGCKLSFDERPYGCRTLIPNINFACEEGAFIKRMAYESWNPYHDILNKLYEKYKETDYKVSGKRNDDPLDMLLSKIIGEVIL